MGSELRSLPELLVQPGGPFAPLSAAAIAVWQIGATLALMAVPGWLLSRRLGILVRGAPERLVMTLAGSLGVLIAGGFALNVTGIGLTTGSWMAWVGATTALLSSAGLFRFVARRRARRVSKLVGAPHAAAPRPVRFATDLRTSQAVLLLLAALVAVAALIVARASAGAPVGSGFTQLWVLAPGEGIQVAAASDGMARIGVENHEGISVRYRVVASTDGQSLTTWESIDLDDGERWTTLTALPAGGSLQIQLYLEDGSNVHRSVHLEPGPAQ